MIILRIKAGLGNQMFQYACGRALAMRNRDILKLDLNDWLSGKETFRPYLLSKFNIAENVATESEINKLKYRFGKFIAKSVNKVRTGLHVNRANVAFNKNIYKLKGSAYLDGYWQSEKYFADFADQIRKDFQLKDPLGQKASEFMEKIKNDKASVSVNVRRGDNAHNPSSMKVFGCPGMDYYKNAIRAIVDDPQRQEGFDKKINLYIFSDEIEWAKENFHTEYSTVFVTQPDIKLWEEIALMSACRHNIISNSTFGWWGAWLNQNPKKIIVAPKQWALKRLRNYKDIIPESWIRV